MFLWKENCKIIQQMQFTPGEWYRKILVTIDPPSRDVVDIKTRRKHFYIRNGFKETGYYIKSFGNEQEILASGGEFSKVGFSVFLLIYGCFAIWPRIEKQLQPARSLLLGQMSLGFRGNF